MRKEAPFKPTTLKERSEFYRNEFDINKVRRWFKQRGIKNPQLCAVDAGTETGVIINKKYKGQMLYFPFTELKKKIKKYIPEDIYYDRNVYSNAGKVLKSMKFPKPITQELVFDIDADNIPCTHPKSEQICHICLDKAFSAAKKIQKMLNKNFSKIHLVYSGRGFHVHVFDEKAYHLTFKERAILNRKFAKFPIDPWVSEGHIRLVRMPYTLNGLVSRIVTPMDTKNAFDERKTRPKFLKD